MKVDMATATRPLDWLADFPAIPEGWAYLDSAATAQKPRAVIDAIVCFITGHALSLVALLPFSLGR